MKADQVRKFYLMYLLLLCLILAISAFLLLYSEKRNRPAPAEGQIDWIYVYESQGTETTDSISSLQTQGWYLRTYEGKIGIFNENGGLVDIIDTYVKTLPKTDQQLLEEGIYARDESMLQAWIEDYSE